MVSIILISGQKLTWIQTHRLRREVIVSRYFFFRVDSTVIMLLLLDYRDVCLFTKDCFGSPYQVLKASKFGLLLNILYFGHVISFSCIGRILIRRLIVCTDTCVNRFRVKRSNWQHIVQSLLIQSMWFLTLRCSIILNDLVLSLCPNPNFPLMLNLFKLIQRNRIKPILFEL